MRLYNGCPDDELQAVIDAREADTRRLHRAHPEARVTYHHPHGDAPGGWQVHIWGRPFGIQSQCRHTAINSGIEALNKEKSSGLEQT